MDQEGGLNAARLSRVWPQYGPCGHLHSQPGVTRRKLRNGEIVMFAFREEEGEGAFCVLEALAPLVLTTTFYMVRTCTQR